MGFVTIVDPRNGPDDMEMTRRVSPDYFRDPYPLSRRPVSGCRQQRDSFPLRGRPHGVDLRAYGKRCPVAMPRAATSAAARPGAGHRRPHVSRDADRPACSSPTSTRAATWRASSGAKSKKLLILEQLPKPANFSGGVGTADRRRDIHPAAGPRHRTGRRRRFGVLRDSGPAVAVLRCAR